MEIGAAIEPWILEQWEKRSDIWLDQTQVVWDKLAIIQSQDYPWLLHSPDALLLCRPRRGSSATMAYQRASKSRTSALTSTGIRYHRSTWLRCNTVCWRQVSTSGS